MSDYFFERVDKKNLNSIIELYFDSFKVKVDLKFLNMKFDTVAFGKAFIGYIAFQKESRKAVGFYGVFPMRGMLENRNVLIAQSGDTMTHPDHQGKGLFTALAKLTYELAKNEGISFVFGFPNKNSYPGFVKKLSWDHYENINNYVVKTGALPIDKFIKKTPILRGIYEDYVQSKLISFLNVDLFENSLKDQEQGYGYIPHDLQFFKYKCYFKIFNLKIGNTKCIVKIDGRMWVGDMQYIDENSFIESIEAIKKLAYKIGCSSLHFSFFNNCVQDKILKRKYGLSSTMPVGCLNLLEGAQGQKFAYQAVDFDTY